MSLRVMIREILMIIWLYLSPGSEPGLLLSIMVWICPRRWSGKKQPEVIQVMIIPGETVLMTAELITGTVMTPGITEPLPWECTTGRILWVLPQRTVLLLTVLMIWREILWNGRIAGGVIHQTFVFYGVAAGMLLQMR